MDNKILAKQVFEQVFPVIKTGLINADDQKLSSIVPQTAFMIWHKIRSHIFYEATDLAIDPADEDLQGTTRNKIRKLLEENEHLKSAIIALLKEATDNSGENNVIKNSENVIQNSTISVGGNFHQGNKTVMTHHGSGDIVGGDKIINH